MSVFTFTLASTPTPTSIPIQSLLSPPPLSLRQSLQSKIMLIR